MKGRVLPAGLIGLVLGAAIGVCGGVDIKFLNEREQAFKKAVGQ